MALAYAYFRGFHHVYWNDTAGFANTSFHPGLTDLSISRWRIFSECVTQLQGDGYRPLSCYINAIGLRHSTDLPDYLNVFVSLNAVLQGVLACLVFVLGVSFGLKRIYALLAAFLMVASVPNLTASLVISGGIQSLIPILMALTLIVFRRYGTRFPRAVAVFTGLVMFFAPFLREFLGIIPLLLLFIEYFMGARRRGWLLFFAAGFVHSLLPTLILHLAGIHSLPIRLVNKMGNLGAALGEGSKHWRIFADIFSIMPPTLLLLMCAFGLWRLWQLGWRKIEPRVYFLLFFFAVTFLPFIKVFNEQVHLGYCLLPLSILMALAVQGIMGLPLARGARALSVLLIALSLADQAANFFNVRKVTVSMYDKIESMAGWLKQNVNKGDGLVGHMHHLACLYEYSGRYFEPWGSEGCVFPEATHCMNSEQALREALQSKAHPFYLLDLTADQPVHRRIRRSVVKDYPGVTLEPVADLGALDVQYVFFDPLRNFIPLEYWAWLGSPDLEFDFSRGPASDGSWFHGQVVAHYRLYRIKL